MARFTEREEEVGYLVAEGLTGPQIATALQISESTVRDYIHRMGRLLEGDAPPMRRIALHFATIDAEEEEVTP